MPRKKNFLSENNDIYYMKLALKQAHKAFSNNEVPVGAVVVGPDGTILARAYNLVERRHQQTAHAELLAINKASKKLGDWRLNDCTVYVTLEPCAMCMALLRLSRVKRVVFGASSPLFGYGLDKQPSDSVYTKSIDLIKEGVCAQESRALLKQFFKLKRKKSE